MKIFSILFLFTFSILYTSSQAQQWQDVTPAGYVFGIYSNSFINSNEGWLCARDSPQINSAQLLHTSNACLDWDTCFTFPGGMRFNRIQMIDSVNGYAAGGYGLSIFWHTTDGGHTWLDITDTVLMQNGGPLEQSIAFYFVSADTGFYGGLNCIYKTTDQGLNWNTVNTPPDGIPSTPEIDDFKVQQLYFYGSMYGWAVCVSSWRDCLFKTSDGGTNWEFIRNTGEYTLGLHFIDSMTGGYARVNWNGAAILTKDNFISSYVYSFLPSLQCLHFQNDSVVWVGGWHDGFIQRSTDSGLTFETINPTGILPGDFGVSSITFFENSGYAIGSHVFKYIDTLNTAVRPVPLAKNTINLYPNPTDDNGTIDITADKPEKVTIELYSPEGKCVLAKTENLFMGDNHIRLSVTSLNAGIYFLRIKGTHINIVRKLVIKR